LHRYDEIALFEIGRIFDANGAGPRTEKNSAELLPAQNVHLGMVYAAKGENNPFFVVKETLSQISEECGLDFSYVKPQSILGYAHSGRVADVCIGKVCVGIIAELHPAAAKALGIDTRAAFVEIDLDICAEKRRSVRKYIDIKDFPVVTRDVAIVVSRTLMHSEIVAAITNANSLVSRVELFDVYEGEKIDQTKKSVAYHITLGSGDHTLSAEEIEAAMKKILAELKHKFGAELRS